MSKNNWLQFAGLLSDCIYQLNHEKCPFNNFRKMDQYKRMEFLLSITDDQAAKMMKSCMHQQGECMPLVYQKQPSGWGVALAS